MGLAEPWLSVIGGGLAAAVVTFGFNAMWDRHKQRIAEDWEFRRYRASQVHTATFGLMEVFFATKTELGFLVGTLETLQGTLARLTAQAVAIVRLQSGPQPTIAELEQRKALLLQPFHDFNLQQVTIRWNQHEQKAADLRSKAEAYLAMLQPLVPESLYEQVRRLFETLSAPWGWNLAEAVERFKLFEDSLPKLRRLHEQLAQQIEVKLGRAS